MGWTRFGLVPGAVAVTAAVDRRLGVRGARHAGRRPGHGLQSASQSDGVSFRDGMGGLSGLLGARSLSVVSGLSTGGSSAESAVTGSGTVYGWFSGSVSAYGGGALWVATSGGLVACLNPVTGRVRAEETASRQGVIVYAVAADRAARRLLAVIGTTASTGVVTISVVTITPPQGCWG